MVLQIFDGYDVATTVTAKLLSPAAQTAGRRARISG